MARFAKYSKKSVKSVQISKTLVRTKFFGCFNFIKNLSELLSVHLKCKNFIDDIECY